MVFVVMTPVGELLFKALGDNEAVLGIDGQVAGIEERMKVGAEKQAVADLVTSPVRIGPDVRGFQDWQGFLLGNCTATSVRIKNGNPEAGLAEPRLSHVGSSVSVLLLLDARGYWAGSESFLDLGP